jgi:hypothetical protein
MASTGTGSWFATLTNVQLKDLLVAGSLPVSGTKAIKMERLLKSPYMSVYDSLNEDDDALYHDSDNDITENDRYSNVLRLLRKRNSRAILKSTDPNAAARVTTTKDGSTATTASTSTTASASEPPTKKARLVKVLQDDALDKRVAHRLKKLNKQIGDRLKWKPSFKYSAGKIAGCRIDVECPEPEVFQAMFGAQHAMIKTNQKTGKMTRTFSSVDDLHDAGIHGKSFRFGARASLQTPASATLHEGKLVLSFKYTVSC